jgi:hypothetical protein
MNNKFVDNVTPICADWLNTVDQLVYEIFDEATTAEEARDAISAVEEAPQDGNLYARRNGQWELVADAPELQILTMYLGAHPSPPTSGFNGQPLKVGMLYYDTTYEAGRVFTGTTWLFFTDTPNGVTITNYSANRWPMNIVEAADGTRTVFTIQDQGGTNLNIQHSAHVEVYVDGHQQRPDVDYTAAGSALTFTEAPLATSNLWGIWIDDDGNTQP